MQRPLFALGALVALTACDPVEQTDAARLYTDHCASCHGSSGTGDGLLADGLTPRPADLTRIAARNGGTFDLVSVMSTIDGYKLPERSMPRFGDMLAEAEYTQVDTGDGVMTPTPIPLLALAEYLKGLQQP